MTTDTPPAALAPADQALAIQFKGSGSEYFRIWIVNLLLTIVTLSLYRPWAKVRRLRYFYGNTLIGGHALDFHGNPRTMLRGYLLVGVLAILYSAAGNFSPIAGLVALAIVSAVWPALMRASMQFRLANTSWRGLRFRFAGTLGGAYKVVLTMLIPIGLMASIAFMVTPGRPPSPWILVAVLAAFASTPIIWFAVKRYQHDNYGIGTWQTRFDASLGSFYGVFLKTAGVFLLMMVALGVIVAVVVAAGAVAAFGGGLSDMSDNKKVALVLAAMIPFFIGLLVMQLVPQPYFVSRMQNLLWSKTRAERVVITSALRFGPLFRLTLKNWFLMIITLGLYWPFAAVALYRIKVEAVSANVIGGLDDLVARGAIDAGDAAGDAAGDLFGIDIGL